MDHDDNGRANLRDMPVYSWHNKQEGKEEYAKFSKEFSIHIKQLRYLLDPAAVTRRLGDVPAANPPANAQLRKEWREDKRNYVSRQNKIDNDFAEALSALERSFVFASPPRHIIDTTIENRPADIAEADWTYERKFRACWEALRVEYQPSTAVDLSQLREQIFALNDQLPGGFDTFRAEFHRLHAEIVATRVPNGIRDEELNEIVRQGLRNPMVWAFVGFNIYSANPNAPWPATFEAVSTFLTSFRQKGMDPYDQAQGGPLIGHLPVSANVVATPSPGDKRSELGKRQLSTPRDSSGRLHKSNKAPGSVSSSSDSFVPIQTKPKWATPQTPATFDNRKERKCTRCWSSNSHNFKTCQETRCVCGKALTAGQLICYNYDSHPPSAQFPDKVPPALASSLEAFRKGRSSCSAPANPPTPAAGKGKPHPSRGRGKKGAKAMVAQLAEELTRRGVIGSNLDSSA